MIEQYTDIQYILQPYVLSAKSILDGVKTENNQLKTKLNKLQSENEHFKSQVNGLNSTNKDILRRLAAMEKKLQ